MPYINSKWSKIRDLSFCDFLCGGPFVYTPYELPPGFISDIGCIYMVISHGDVFHARMRCARRIWTNENLVFWPFAKMGETYITRVAMATSSLNLSFI